MTDPVLILERAVDVIHEGGWTVFSYGATDDRSARHCTVGAIQTAAREFGLVQSGDVARAYNACRRVLQLGPDAFALENWNDQRALDGDDVVHMFKQAAESLR